MKSVVALIGLLVVVAMPVSATVVYGSTQGWCEQGAHTITIGGVVSPSNTTLMRSYPSCTVTVYFPGTTNKATLYSTATGVSMANPFSADVNGWWTFFSADGNYDVAFSGGGIPVPFTQFTKPANDPYFESSLSGYVPRTKNAKLADVISVEDFGADATGALDSTTAINNAAALSVIGKGSTPSVCIYFPSGIYKITAALSYNHTVCFVGEQWRIAYAGGSTIASMLALVGDVNNVYGSHCSGQSSNCYLEGSIVNGAILDGNGKATNGFTLQGVVGAQVGFMRVTNVTGAGVNCNWCQQATFERLQVSSDYEAFTTTPTNGIIIDNISSANILNQVNIDHVSGTGVVLKYALNTLIHGGTSEGNGGFGLLCQGASTPTLYECFNNVAIQFDTEVNTLGDYSFDDVGGGGHVFDNAVFESNSFSNPGYTFTGGAHSNIVTGGSIGCGSTASIHTFGNRLVGVAVSCSSGTPWVDNGQNWTDRIYNQSTGTFTEPINNYNNTYVIDNSAGAPYGITLSTPTGGLSADFTLGKPANNFTGFNCQNGQTACWLTYSTNGVELVSETAPNTMAIPDGIIGYQHMWGVGRFNLTPAYTLHVWDSVSSTIAVQTNTGQAAHDMLAFLNTGGSRMSGVTFNGRWDGPLAATAFPVNGTNGHALCKKAADGTFGTCSTVVASDGTCTCN